MRAFTSREPVERVLPNTNAISDGTAINAALTEYVHHVELERRGRELVQSLEYRLFYVTGDAGMPHLLEWARTKTALGLDLETSAIKPFDGQIATLQIGNPKGSDPRAYVIDVRTVSRAALQPLLELLASYRVTKLGQNIKFECKWLQHHFGCRVRRVADTQVTEHVMRAGLFQAKAARVGGGGGEKAGYRFSSMAWLAQFYLGLDIDKDQDLRTGFYDTPPGQHSPRQLAYAALDVIYPFVIAEKQAVEVEARALKGIVKVEFETIPVLADAELTGMAVDQDRWRVLYQEAVKNASIAQRALDALMRASCPQQDLFSALKDDVRPVHPGTNKAINYNSPEQVKWVITAYCQQIGWEREIVTTWPRIWQLKRQYGQRWLEKARERELRKTERGEKSKTLTERDIPDHVIPEERYTLLMDTDKATLKLRMVRGQLPKELVTYLLEYGKYEIRVSSFGAKFLEKNIDKRTHRLHTEFHQCVTNTGRISTTPNTQNIPNDQRYRHCFVPGAGRKFIIADYSQIEPRLSAQVSLDPVYTAAFLAGKDLYVQVAEAMFQVVIDLSTEEGANFRKVAKVIVLGLAYRMGPWKLRDTLTLAQADDILAGKLPAPTIDEVSELYRRFFEECTGIRDYQDFCSKIADHEETDRAKIYDELIGDVVTWVEAPCSRKRFFPPESKNVFTESPNAPIQGCSATITKAAGALFQRELDQRGWAERAHVVNLVHDEIVAEVEDAIAVECARLLQECMERAGRFYVTTVPVLAEFPKNTNGVVQWWTKEEK